MIIAAIFRKLLQIFLLLGFCVSAADAGVYKCRDETGKVTFQDRRCPIARTQDGVVRETLGEAKSARHFLWKAASAEGVLYLFGSIHFGHAGLYPLDSVITDAFFGSDVLVVEANVLKVTPDAILTLIGENGAFQDGSTLRMKVGEKMWNDLVASAEKLGAPVAMFTTQKPWLAALTLVSLSMTRSGYSDDMGMDRYFLKQAGAGKEILELESLQQQFEMLRGMSEDEALFFLSQTLRDIEKGDDYVNAMFSAWREGDSSWFENMLKEGFDERAVSKQFYASMFTERNLAMAARLESLVKDGRTYFVVVGAGHLVGEKGIVNLLKTKGFQVSQM